MSAGLPAAWRAAARGTRADEQQIVVLDDGTDRRERLDRSDASLDLIKPVARAAEEMVVVIFPGPLEECPIPRKLDTDQPALIAEQAQGPVDGRDAQARHPSSRGRQHAGRIDRVGHVEKDLADRISLAGVSSHGQLTLLPFSRSRTEQTSQLMPNTTHCTSTISGPVLRLPNAIARKSPAVTQPAAHTTAIADTRRM